MSRCVKVRRARIAAFLVLLMVVGMLAPLARAANTFADIQYWVGSGSNQAALVMDWNDGKTSESYIWGFRWNGSATGATMLSAIVNADARLFAHADAGSSSLYGAGYDLNDNAAFGTSAGAAMGFNANGLALNDTHFDGSTPTDAGDHWSEGWFANGFWGYYDGGTGTSPVWDFASSGMGGRTLVNGSWDGYSWAPGFSDSTPSDAVAAVPAPEPCSIGLLAIGAIFVCKRRR